MLELPNELVIAVSLILTGFFTKLIVDGLKGLSESLGFDLSKPATIIAAAVSAAVVSIVIGLVNFGLSFVPAAYWPIVQAVFTVLIGALGAMGFHRKDKLSRA